MTHNQAPLATQQLMSLTLWLWRWFLGFWFSGFGFFGFLDLALRVFFFFFAGEVLARLAAEPNPRGNKNVAIKEKLNCNKAP